MKLWHVRAIHKETGEAWHSSWIVQLETAEAAIGAVISRRTFFAANHEAYELVADEIILSPGSVYAI